VTGAERIAAERNRQVKQERWTPGHDDEHTDGQLAWAAVCYAAPGAVGRLGRRHHAFDPWPWADEWYKRPENPTRAERIRMLEKAGALIAAEIDRLLRAEVSDPSKDKGAT